MFEGFELLFALISVYSGIALFMFLLWLIIRNKLPLSEEPTIIEIWEILVAHNDNWVLNDKWKDVKLGEIDEKIDKLCKSKYTFEIQIGQLFTNYKKLRGD